MKKNEMYNEWVKDNEQWEVKMMIEPGEKDFLLQKVYSDGTKGEPEIYKIDGMDFNWKMGRRGFLATTAIGLIFLNGCAKGKTKSSTSNTDISRVTGNNTQGGGNKPEGNGKETPAPSRGAGSEPTPAPTSRPSPTNTPKPSPTNTPTPSPTSTPTPAPTNTPTPTPTSVPTATPKPVPADPLPEGKCYDWVKAHTYSVDNTVLSPDGQYPISTARYEMLKIWKIPEGNLLACIDVTAKELYSLIVSDNGKRFAMENRRDKTVETREIPSGKLVSTIAVSGQPNQMIISPDGKVLITKVSYKLSIWDTTTGKELISDNDIFHVVLSPDGKQAALKKACGIIELMDMGTFEKTMTDKRDINQVLYSPDGKQAALVKYDHMIYLMDMVSFTVEKTLKNKNDIDYIFYSPDGKYFISCGQYCTFDIWEAHTCELLHSGKTKEIIRGVKISSDGRMIAFVFFGSIVEIYSLPSGEFLRTINADVGDNMERTILFCHGNKTLLSREVSSSYGVLGLYEVSTGNYVKKIGYGDSMGTVSAVAISQTHDLFVVGTEYHQIQLYDSLTGGLINCLFDPAALYKEEKAVQYTIKDKKGQMITYTIPCGSSLPPGAICTCNCVSGTSPIKPVEGGSEGTTICTCNKICTCIPIK